MLGFEALARWRDPELGEIGPSIFIPIAEESGVIASLGAAVMRRAFAEAASWKPPLSIALNLSPLQVQGAGFYEDVAQLLEETGLSPERVELEVTESIMIRDAEAAVATLRRFKALGIRIAMDDFGTGYSSLGYLRIFPFDKLKIDQSFVRHMDESPAALAVVQAVVGLARGLGLTVVAEGVETAGQLEGLRREGCAQVQGYLLGRPAPIESFVGSILERRRGETSSPTASAA